ncbi:HET-domain-containing protein [Apiospora kogelbergensis]|uniref:HET-domain-containing protein n=1 Tax=Apiospora kogelbergensis TaxID=1337665 RepID=UPI00312E0B42
MGHATEVSFAAHYSLYSYARVRGMRSSNNHATRFLQLNSAFPSRLKRSGYSPTWGFLKSMLENYSRRGITKPLDRAIAISGLLDRVEKVLRGCCVHHGIIEWYHRTLLWRRATGQLSSKIEYQPPVPSWSWMAYTGLVVFSNDFLGEHDAFRDL